MNTALSWIKAYVPDLEVTPQEYTDAMTLSGSKVEGYECLDKNLEKIVVGQIKKIERHPDADKLIICQVDIGTEMIQIVTGAPNVQEGDKVPVVLDGGKVAGGHDGGPLPEEGIRIKKGKLRGIESNGMMCSIEELGSSRDMYPDAPELGIYILPEDTPVGADAIDILGLHDVVFEYEITSNRVDCYSVVGLAREAAATFRKKFCPPEIKVTGNHEDIHDYLQVEVKNPDLCPRYCARMVKNIKLAPSPEWMQRRLAASGIRPINNLVDITNYIMEEYGQPMHAFDYDQLAGHKIVVKTARDGDEFQTLDSQVRRLDHDILMLDEPINALDPEGIREMRKLFRRLNRESGTTVFISSHILSEVDLLADTIGILRHGKLLAELPAEEIHKRQTEYISLQVDDVPRAAALLEKKGITNFTAEDQEFIRVYDSDLSGKTLSKYLVENGIGLESLGRRQDTLEDYFFQLTEEGD